MSEPDISLEIPDKSSNAAEPNNDGDLEELSIEEKLKSVKKACKDADDLIGEKSKERDNLKAEITYLEKSISEINQSVVSYNKVYKNIETETKALREYVDAVKKMILSVISESEKKKVDDQITAADTEIITQNGKVEKLLDEDCKTAKSNSDIALNKLNEKQTAYDNSRKYQANIENKIKNLKTLKDLIERADIEKVVDRKKMYFWILKLEEEFSADPQLISSDQLKDELERELKELNAAKEKFRTADDNLKTAQNSYNTEKRVLDSLTIDRDKNILNEISSKEGQ